MTQRTKPVWRSVQVLFTLCSLCCMALAQATSPRIAMFKPTTNQRSQARIQAMLSDMSAPAAMVDMSDDWNSYSLVVLVEPPIPAGRTGGLIFTQKLGAYYFLGGRVLLVGIPTTGPNSKSSDAVTWNRLTHYFWDSGLGATKPLEDLDHRALFIPDVKFLGTLSQLHHTVEKLLTAADKLPEQLPAKDFGPITRVSLQKNSMSIDGRPQLLKSVGYYDLLKAIPMENHEATLRRFHALGFNSAIVIADCDVSENQLSQFLDIAHQNKIYVQLQLQSPLEADGPLRKEYLLKILRLRNHPALIGWAMCDDMVDAYFPFIEKAVSIIRRYDQRLPVTSTFMDVRHPEKVKDWEKWTHLVDFPAEYVYPMQKDPLTNGVRFDIEGGLKDVNRLMENTRKVWPNVFAEQFLQAHMQSTFAEQVGLRAWREHLVPGADQERLLASRALLSGIKGLVFFYPISLTDQGMGRSRANEIAILWRELEPVEDILAAGAEPESLLTSDQTVDASLIRSGNEAVIVAVKDRQYYNRYVDGAVVEGLTVHLPTGAPDCPVFQMGWPHPEKLEVKDADGARVVALNPFALSTILLTTCDETRQRHAQELMKNNLPEVAQYATKVLVDEQVKTMVVSQHLPHELQGDSKLLNDIVKAGDETHSAVAAEDWVKAWQTARAGMISIRQYRTQAMQAATADADIRKASAQARVYLNLYFSLPNYAYVTRGGTAVEPNQLRREILKAEGLPVLESIDPAEANR